jgi:hypothetical protein
MRLTDRRFTEDENELLRRAKGKRLLAIDAVIVGWPDECWHTARLHFEGLDIDIDNQLGDIAIDDSGTTDEFGLMTVREAMSDTLKLPGKWPAAMKMDVGHIVNSVQVVNDHIKAYENGVLVAEFEYPRRYFLLRMPAV